MHIYHKNPVSPHSSYKEVAMQISLSFLDHHELPVWFLLPVSALGGSQEVPMSPTAKFQPPLTPEGQKAGNERQRQKIEDQGGGKRTRKRKEWGVMERAMGYLSESGTKVCLRGDSCGL